jgi:hypothetical protein
MRLEKGGKGRKGRKGERRDCGAERVMFYGREGRRQGLVRAIE